MEKGSTASVLDRAVIVSLAAVFIAYQITSWEPLSAAAGVLAFAAIAALLPQLRGSTLWLASAFLAGGMLLLYAQRADAREWLQAAGVNATLVTLFVFAPLFGIPVRMPAYVEALKRFYATGKRSGGALYAGTQLLTQIMGVFINVGAIPVVYHMAFARPQPGLSRLLANAMNRGFGGAIFWSPYFAAMALVTSALSVSWSDLLPYMLGLSLLSVLVSFAADYRGLRAWGRAEPEEEDPAQADATDRRPGKSPFPIELAVYLVAAMAAILVLERFVTLPSVLITCLAAVVVPFAWCLAKRATSLYRQGLAHHATVTLPSLRKEIGLFLAAGFFSGSIGTTGFGAEVPRWFEAIPLSPQLSFAAATVALVLLTAMIGLHPIVPVTILANGIDPSAVHFSPIAFAVLLLGSWGLSNTVSPASAVNNLLAGLFKKQVFELARPNVPFAAWMAVALICYLSAVRM